MRVCNLCRTEILDPKRSWKAHHGSYASLVNSRKQDCVFCTRLHQDAEEHVEPLVQESEKDALLEDLKERKEIKQKRKEELLKGLEWPVWRWSVRGLAKIRESRACVVVTFRPFFKGANTSEEANFPKRVFYLFPEKDLAPLPTPHTLTTSTDPALSGGNQIRNWFKICDTTHETCSKRRKNQVFVPTRLLDITNPPQKNIKVVETKTLPTKPTYVSLSHCWGKNPDFVQLTTSTYDTYTKRGITWDSLPRNFKEAIEVARFLKAGYIWIDSLCIIQGKDGDFFSEAGKMHSVYRNSYVNLAVVDSMDSKGGLFRNERKIEEVEPTQYLADGENPMFSRGAWRIVHADIWERELLKSFLYKRGWVFQERMLSSRILHFTANQIFWDCPSLSACEALPKGIPQPLDDAAGPDRRWRGRLQETNSLAYAPLAGATDDSLEYFWKMAVRKFTSCDLTMGKDKLIALWGIVKLIRDALEETVPGLEYGDGIWEKNIEGQLAWYVEECKLMVRPNESSEVTIKRVIPSWSWGSMDGIIVVDDWIPKFTDYVVRDHLRRPLAFDLKRTRLYTSPEPDTGDWQDQIRAMSDGIVEMQKRYKDSRGRLSRTDTGESQATLVDDTTPKANRDDPPVFISKSLAIQGHVARGVLCFHESREKWLLHIGGLQGDIDVFPDVKPRPDHPEDNTPFLVVTCANRESSDEQGTTWTGCGIMLKEMKPPRFHRTGAFWFHRVGKEMWTAMMTTYEGVKYLPSMYDEHGLKFILE